MSTTSVEAAPALWVLCGPTGTGKTDWAIEAARRLPLEIVSVDSAMVYRGLDIGTAKPSVAVRAGVAHHLIDICEPTESYSAGRFVSDAAARIIEIRQRGRIPLFVGGTFLYLRALLSGIARLPQASLGLRRELDERAAREGWPALHGELSHLDPEAAARIHPNDSQRIQRALEVCLTAGAPLSQLQREQASAPPPYRLRRWALVPAERAQLHAHLEMRFNTMMAHGFLSEVRSLYQRGDLSSEHAAMRAVGYRQLWAHLSGAWSLVEAVKRGIAATRQLAKRQITWIRSDATLERIDPFAAGSHAEWNRKLDYEFAKLGR
jgi:tRNA dimethylallyltransferase